VLGDIEYPFPSGLYLSRLIKTLHLYARTNPLVALLSNVQELGNKYAKEMSEAMAMVDAVERGVKMACGRSPQSVQGKVRVFVLGDGKRPLCAATLALHFNCKEWTFVSIDPLLSGASGGGNGGGGGGGSGGGGGGSSIVSDDSPCVDLFAGKSQEYSIPREGSALDIVVACHSHAPLQEFWDRLVVSKKAQGVTKLAIVMACCAGFSKLVEEPLYTFEDYEVYSPKRTVQIFSK
jgi:hypothetical protein